MNLPPAVPPTVFASWNQYITGLVNAAGPNPIRLHQREALKQARNFLQGGNDQVQLVMPTGSGKTGIIVLLPYFLNERKVVVVAPKPDIAEQIAVQFVGPNFSGDNYPPLERDAFIFKVRIDPREEVRMSRIQRTAVLPRGSMILRSSDAPQHFHDELMIFNAQRIQANNTTTTVGELPTEGVDLVIVDEAHHYPAATWLNIIDHYQGKPIVFLTATPNVQARFPTWTYTFRKAVEDGVIRDIDLVELPASNDAVGDIITRLKQIVNRHDEPGRFYQAMIKAGSGEAATQILVRYNQGIVDKRERAWVYVQGQPVEIKEAFLRGEFRTMIICHRLIEGFDNPNVAFVAVTSAMRTTPFEQFVGRATRIGDGHLARATIITHVDFGQQANYQAMRGGNWALPADGEEE